MRAVQLVALIIIFVLISVIVYNLYKSRSGSAPSAAEVAPSQNKEHWTGDYEVGKIGVRHFTSFENTDDKMMFGVDTSKWTDLKSEDKLDTINAIHLYGASKKPIVPIKTRARNPIICPYPSTPVPGVTIPTCTKGQLVPYIKMQSGLDTCCEKGDLKGGYCKTNKYQEFVHKNVCLGDISKENEVGEIKSQVISSTELATIKNNSSSTTYDGFYVPPMYIDNTQDVDNKYYCRWKGNPEIAKPNPFVTTVVGHRVENDESGYAEWSCAYKKDGTILEDSFGVDELEKPSSPPAVAGQVVPKLRKTKFWRPKVTAANKSIVNRRYVVANALPLYRDDNAFIWLPGEAYCKGGVCKYGMRVDGEPPCTFKTPLDCWTSSDSDPMNFPKVNPMNLATDSAVDDLDTALSNTYNICKADEKYEGPCDTVQLIPAIRDKTFEAGHAMKCDTSFTNPDDPRCPANFTYTTYSEAFNSANAEDSLDVSITPPEYPIKIQQRLVGGIREAHDHFNSDGAVIASIFPVDGVKKGTPEYTEFLKSREMVIIKINDPKAPLVEDTFSSSGSGTISFTGNSKEDIINVMKRLDIPLPTLNKDSKTYYIPFFLYLDPNFKQIWISGEVRYINKFLKARFIRYNPAPGTATRKFTREGDDEPLTRHYGLSLSTQAAQPDQTLYDLKKPKKSGGGWLKDIFTENPASLTALVVGVIW